MKSGEFKFHGKRGLLAWTPKSTPELTMNFNRASNDPASQVVISVICSARFPPHSAPLRPIFLALQAGLNPFSQGPEVADALNFVVRQLDAEMTFEAGEHLQRLQAVDAESLEKIVSRRERSGGQLKVLRRQVQHFLGRLFQGSHGTVNLSSLFQEGKSDETTPLGATSLLLDTLRLRSRALNVIETTLAPNGAAEISAQWTTPALTTEALSTRADVGPAGTKCSRNTD